MKISVTGSLSKPDVLCRVYTLEVTAIEDYDVGVGVRNILSCVAMGMQQRSGIIGTAVVSDTRVRQSAPPRVKQKFWSAVRSIVWFGD